MRYSRASYWGLHAAGIGLLLLGMFLVELALPPGGAWLKACVLTVLAMSGVGLAFMADRHADEIMSQMHKTAWFWGSLLGTVALLPLMILVTWHLVAVPVWWLDRSTDLQTSFVAGVSSLFLIQGVGFLAVLVWQRLPVRGQ
jgi:hypothetical protein